MTTTYLFNDTLNLEIEITSDGKGYWEIVNVYDHYDGKGKPWTPEDFCYHPLAADMMVWVKKQMAQQTADIVGLLKISTLIQGIKK